MNYNRLVAFGCSYTYGHGLKDCFDGKRKTKPGKLPSKYAWPSVLSRMINVECINMSMPGCSNKKIWNEIVNSDLYQEDIVFVMWTSPFRWCVFDRDKTHDIGHWTRNKQSKAYFKYIFNEYDQNIDLNNRISHIGYYLNDLNICHFQYFYSWKYFKNLSFNNSHISSTSMESYAKLYSKALDRLHPGEKAHYKFAESIYEEIRGII
jgi:hypothetical protein